MREVLQYTNVSESPSTEIGNRFSVHQKVVNRVMNTPKPVLPTDAKINIRALLHEKILSAPVRLQLPANRH